MENMNSRRWVGLIYCIVVVLLGPLYALVRAEDLLTFGDYLCYILTMISLFGIFLSFMRMRHYFIVAWVFVLFSLFDMAHLLFYKCTTSLMWVFSGIKSEGYEGAELVSVGFPVLMILGTAWVLYFVANHYCVPREYVASHRTRSIIAIAMGAWLLIATGGVTLTKCTGYLPSFNACLKVCPINFIYDFGEIGTINHIVTSTRDTRDKFVWNATTTAPDDCLVVLVLGEATRYRQLQINGYARETTPLLLERDTTIVSFDSVYTVANLTTVSVPLMLSRATPHDMWTYVDESSVVDAFHQAGYNTSWLAVQSFNNHFLMEVSGRCDYVYYHENRMGRFYDESLFAPFQQCLSEAQGRQMMVLHTRGCHFMYTTRYPESFRYFRPDLDDVDWGSIQPLLDMRGNSIDAGDPSSPAVKVVRRLLVNSYDNGIRYVDHVLDSVISTLEATHRPAVMLYVGDHGENLLDDDNHKMLHGLSSTSIYEYHVPLMVWMSDEYKALHPEMMETLRANKEKHISTMNVFHSLLQLGDVEMDSLNYSMSIASPQLQADTVAWTVDADLRLSSIATDEP